MGLVHWRQIVSHLSPGRRSLVGYSPWGYRVGHDWTTFTSFPLAKS